MKEDYLKWVNRLNGFIFFLIGLFITFYLVPKIQFDMVIPIITASGIFIALIGTFLVINISSEKVRESIKDFINKGSEFFEDKIKEKSEELKTSKEKSRVYSELASIAGEKEAFERIKNIKKYFLISFIFLGLSLVTAIFLPDQTYWFLTKNQVISSLLWIGLFGTTQVVLAFILALPEK